MKKFICNKFSTYFAIGIFGIYYGLFNIIGLKTFYRGKWYDSDLHDGLFFGTIAIAIFIFSKLFCRESAIYKYLSCEGVYEEKDIKNLRCPDCDGEIIDIKILYTDQNINKNHSSKKEWPSSIKKQNQEL